MGKKMKLSLDDLKVQSFVTSLDGEKDKLRGGTWSVYGSCAVCTLPGECSEGPCETGERCEDPRF